MATEVGQAYITLIPSAKGFASNMQSELAGDIAKVGQSIGDDLSKEVGDSGEEAGKSFGSKLRDNIGKVAIAGAGAALGGLGIIAGKALGDAFSADAMRAKLTAQLGLTKKQSAEVGKVAGNAFADNYGDSMEDVNVAVGAVIQNIDGMRKASEGDLTRISEKALGLSSIFGVDVVDSTRAVSQMIRTGMAKNADQAMDIITRGFQTGVDKSGDFLDTLNEYGTQFRKLGLNGKAATGILRQGLQGGARDADLVADSLKEFSIRAVDGSKTTAAGYKALGLDAKAMTEQIAKGGPNASKGLQTVMNRLRAIKDPAKQSQAAVALFGTQAEDMGKALLRIDPSKAVKGLGKVRGAADKSNQAFAETPTQKVAAFTRQLQGGLVNVIAQYVIPLVSDLTPLLQLLAGAFDLLFAAIKPVLDFFKQHTTTLKVFTAAIAILVGLTYAHAAAIAIQTGAMKEWLIQTKIVQAATKAWAAIQWVMDAAMAAFPIVLIILGIIALIAVIVIIVKKLGGFHAAMEKVGHVMDAVWKGIKAAWGKVKDAVVNAVQNVVGWLKGHWKPLLLTALLGPFGLIIKLVADRWDDIRDKVRGGIDAVVGFIRSMPGRVIRLASSFASAGRKVIEAFVNGMKNASGIVTGIAGNVWDALKGLINSAISKINAALDFTIHLPGPDVHINIPDISPLAGGGRVTGSTLALIGEGNEPETVLPDSMLRGLLERTAMGGASELRLVVDGYEFNAYVDARADERHLSANALGAERRRAGWR